MKLLTKSILKQLPPMRSQENNPDPVAIVKFFNPAGSGTWYATEFDPATEEFFGFVTGLGSDELGYFSLRELEAFRGRFGLGIERDLHFEPVKLSELRPQVAPVGPVAPVATHTPGPWVVAVERVPHSNEMTTYVHAVDPAASIESGYRSVPFHIGYAGGAESQEREQANAALVAAAPDLLDACERAIRAGTMNDQTVIDGLVAAIAKARGGK